MLIDSTLREGEQLFGAYFSLEDKKIIVRNLMEIGIEEIEIGHVDDPDVAELIPWMRSLRLPGVPTVGIWAPCRVASVKAAARLCPDWINIGVPASIDHMHHRVGLDEESLIARIEEITRDLSKLRHQFRVSVGLEDGSRARTAELLRFARRIASCDVDRIRLSDTVGLMTPLETRELVAALRESLPVPLAFHGHNDFGMATANSITAIESGASFVDVSVLGIGERAGIASLEEVVGYLSIRSGKKSYSLRPLRKLCTFVAEKSGIVLPRHKPIAGQDIFSCETGLHIHGIRKSPDLFEPFDPDEIGAGRKLGLGKKSGRASVAAALEEMGISRPDDLSLQALVSAIKEVSRMLGRPLTSKEVAMQAETILGIPGNMPRISQ